MKADNDFERGIRCAVNHSGDSDSTGAIAGNIMGAALGDAVIPQSWQQKIELGNTIKRVARAHFDMTGNYETRLFNSK